MKTASASRLPIPFTAVILVVSALLISVISMNPVKAAADPLRVGKEYVATRYGIPIGMLESQLDVPLVLPTLGRTYRTVLVADHRQGGEFYHLWIEGDTGAILEDVEALRQAEREAQFAKYGVLDPALYDYLQTVRADKQLSVVIWAAPAVAADGTSLEIDPMQVLMQRYPEVREALARGSKFEDVGDPELAKRVYHDWLELGDMMYTQRTQPVVDRLRSRGVTVNVPKGAPFVTAVLPAPMIPEVAKWHDVTRIDLETKAVPFENESSSPNRPDLDTSVPHTLVPLVGARGIDGSNMQGGIIESGANVDFSWGGANCPNRWNCWRACNS